MNQPDLTILLLGGLSITQKGTAVTNFASRKADALLAYLACNPRPHPRETLATLFWPENDQSRALANLSVILTSLRKQLGDYLLAERHTIAFNSQMSHWLDVVEFERAIDQAQTWQTSDKLSRTVAVQLRTAVSCYNGDFLAGFNLRGVPEFEAWVLLEQERLRQMMLDSLSALITFYQQRGQFSDGIHHAQRLLALDPLQEEAHRQLMLFYALNNQRSAALAQYEQCTAILTDELGVQPDEETTALYAKIKDDKMTGWQGDKVISQENVTLSPGHLVTRSSLHNLPIPTTTFIGREAELAQMEKLLAEPDGRLLTIIGPGGMGKTRLAEEFARRHLGEFADGVWLVSLVPTQDDTGFVSTVADAVGLKFAGSLPPAQQLRRYLQNKEMLLILDNFEQLLAGTAVTLISDITRQAPELKLLITSRSRLNIQAETLLELHGLPFPIISGRLSVSREQNPVREGVAQRHYGLPFTDYPAVQLFTNRARRIRADFNLAGQETAVMQLCQLVGGLPLALELAASWIRALSLPDIITKIRQGLDLLATTLRDVPERHRSMVAVFNQSWQLLTKSERNLYARLAVFRGGFTREAAEQVAGASLPLLAALVDKSLLRRGANGRYRRHPLLVQFAEQKLMAEPEMETAVRKQHASYFATWMQPKLKLIRQMETAALREIRAETENLRAAWNWAVQNAHVPFFSKIWRSYYYYLLDLEALYEEGIAQFAAAAKAIEQRPDAVQHRQLLASLWARFGWYHMELNQIEGARTALEKSLAIARAGQFREEEAYAYSRLGLVTAWQGDLAKAQAILEEVLAFCRQYSEAESELVSALNYLGVVLQYQGDYAASLPLCEESAQLARAGGDLTMLDVALTNLGAAWLYLKEYQNARQTFLECAALEQRLGNRSRQAVNLHNLMYTCWEMGDYGAARDYGYQAMTLFKEVQQQQYLSLTYATLAEIELANDDLQAAGEWQQQALELAQTLEMEWVQLSVLLTSAVLLRAQGEQVQAVMVLFFVQQHETAFAEHRERAEKLLSELEPSPAQMAQAQATTAAATVKSLISNLAQAGKRCLNTH